MDKHEDKEKLGDRKLADNLDIKYISLEEARELGREICERFSAAFEMLKDK